MNILVDASTIHKAGAFRILDLVLKGLKTRNHQVIFIRDTRNNVTPGYEYQYTSDSFIRRKALYKTIVSRHQIDVQLSLISIPPPINLDCPCFTLFHNTTLLSNSNSSNDSVKQRILQFGKRKYLNAKKNNSDYFIFQSSLIQNYFLSEINFRRDKCYVFPFYDEEFIRKIKQRKIEKIQNQFIYVSIDYPHKNHLRLLDAWDKLKDDNLTPKLLLTIPKDNIRLVKKIEELNIKGCKIVNLGVIPYETCLEYTAKSEYTIFPSLNESLGLNLVESQILGNKIIASNLDYVAEAVLPNRVFDPMSSESIYNAVKDEMKNKTELLPKLNMSNSLEKFLDKLEEVNPSVL